MQALIGFFELGEFLDAADPPDTQRPADRAEGDDVLHLMADPDQGLL